MEEQTLKAADNAALANDLISKALADPKENEPKQVEIKLPSDTSVDLPGGYVLISGEVVRTAEVRELNGYDEEAIARAGTVGKVINTILSRAVVKIGDEPATEALLDAVLSGDRDALALGIYKATFDNPAELEGYCDGCDEFKTVAVDLNTDIKTKILADADDRVFTVKGRSKEYTVALPSGKCQRELNNASSEKTISELQTILLEQTVVEIDGKPVYNPAVVKSLSIPDRRKIANEIGKRNPGPQFEPVTALCPDCGSEVVVPISLGALFRL